MTLVGTPPTLGSVPDAKQVNDPRRQRKAEKNCQIPRNLLIDGSLLIMPCTLYPQAHTSIIHEGRAPPTPNVAVVPTCQRRKPLHVDASQAREQRPQFGMTVRPVGRTLTDASCRSSRTPTTKTRLCRLPIPARERKDFADGVRIKAPCGVGQRSPYADRFGARHIGGIGTRS